MILFEIIIFRVYIFLIQSVLIKKKLVYKNVSADKQLLFSTFLITVGASNNKIHHRSRIIIISSFIIIIIIIGLLYYTCCSSMKTSPNSKFSSWPAIIPSSYWNFLYPVINNNTLEYEQRNFIVFRILFLFFRSPRLLLLARCANVNVY